MASTRGASWGRARPDRQRRRAAYAATIVGLITEQCALDAGLRNFAPPSREVTGEFTAEFASVIYLMEAHLFTQRYEIGRELGRGSQGAVTHLITDRETKKAWAANIIERGLKVVPPKTHTHTHPQTQHTQVSHMMF